MPRLLLVTFVALGASAATACDRWPGGRGHPPRLEMPGPPADPSSAPPPPTVTPDTTPLGRTAAEPPPAIPTPQPANTGSPPSAATTATAPPPAATATRPGVPAQPSTAAAPATAAPAWPPAASLARHGGVIALPNVIYAEVVPVQAGRLAIYLRDARHSPVQASDVRVTVRGPDGTVVPVATRYDTAQQAHIGRVTAGRPGAFTVEVGVKTTPDGVPTFLTTPALALAPAALPPATHGGAVQAVGEYTVEVVPASHGQLALFWTDAQGAPLPAEQVSLASLTASANGRRITVPVRAEGGVHYARLPGPLPPELSVSLAPVAIRDARFTNVVVARVAAPTGAVYGGGPAGPRLPQLAPPARPRWSPGVMPPDAPNYDDDEDDGREP